MDVIHIQTRYTKEVIFPKNLINKIKETTKKQGPVVAIYSSIQFLHTLDKLKTLLEKNNIKTITSKPKRAYFISQILGCDAFPESLNFPEKTHINAYLYIGDGNFHPNALLFSQKNSETPVPVITYNPISEEIKTLTIKNIQKNLKKYKSNLAKFITSKNIGIFITTKHGQYQKQIALKLKKELKNKQKTAYLFIGDNFSKQEIENFPFIDVWINTACPRIAYDDIIDIKQPIININDALDTLKNM